MSKTVVLLPCYNEEAAIGKVIADFQRVLPEAEILVYDNNSTDKSAEIAAAAGVKVIPVPMQGKGNVVRTMFRDIEADCYLMVDADDTYPAEVARELIAPVLEGRADMVTGDRLSTTYYDINKRKFHNFGNTLVCTMIKVLFKQKISDVMTGYRAFSRRFVKNFPVMNGGFELETEMTIFALERRLNILEVPVEYRDRPAGSESKLNTFSDGFKVIFTILRSLREYRPMFFFGVLAIFCFALAIGFFIPVFIDFVNTGKVPRFPTLICSVCSGVAGMIMITCGLVLNSIKHHFSILMELALRKNQ